MSLHRLITFIILLLFLPLIVFHTSKPKETVTAQTETNFQISEIYFDADSILSSNIKVAPTPQFPVSELVVEYIPNEIAENVLELDGESKYVYLPFIYNNFLYFFDDFSNTNNGFPIIDTTTNNYQYVNGEYQILNKTSDYLGAVSIGHKLDEFQFEVSMRRVGSARGLYGLIFWLDETWSEYYLFLVSPDDGEYYFYQYNASSGFSILTFSQNYQFLNLGNSVNRLGMKQFRQSGVGLITEFTTNGFTIYPNVGTPKEFYRVGLVAAPIDANHQVLFDDYLFKNYCILYPGCSN